jgi:hypothetical protein
LEDSSLQNSSDNFNLHIITSLEICVDNFIANIKAEKAFSNPILDYDKFKDQLGRIACWGIENKKYYTGQGSLTHQKKYWKKAKNNLIEELKKGEPMRGLVTSHMSCKTPLEAYHTYKSILSEEIKINEVKSIVSRSLEARKSTQGVRGIAEFNSQIISILISIFKEHQSHCRNRPYKTTHAYSSGGYVDDGGEDPKGKRVPTQFTIFCDLFFKSFLNEPNLNSHKTDIIIKATKKHNLLK